MALPPDNQAMTEASGATVKLGRSTRLTADIALGQWKQNEDAVHPLDHQHRDP